MFLLVKKRFLPQLKVHLIVTFVLQPLKPAMWAPLSLCCPNSEKSLNVLISLKTKFDQLQSIHSLHILIYIYYNFNKLESSSREGEMIEYCTLFKTVVEKLLCRNYNITLNSLILEAMHISRRDSPCASKDFHILVEESSTCGYAVTLNASPHLLVQIVLTLITKCNSKGHIMNDPINLVWSPISLYILLWSSCQMRIHHLALTNVFLNFSECMSQLAYWVKCWLAIVEASTAVSLSTPGFRRNSFCESAFSEVPFKFAVQPYRGLSCWFSVCT